jgi:hypothetical protein
MRAHGMAVSLGAVALLVAGALVYFAWGRAHAANGR